MHSALGFSKHHPSSGALVNPHNVPVKRWGQTAVSPPHGPKIQGLLTCRRSLRQGKRAGRGPVSCSTQPLRPGLGHYSFLHLFLTHPVQNKGFQVVMTRFSFLRGKHTAWLSHWSATSQPLTPLAGTRPPTRTPSLTPSLFLLNNQSPVLSHLSPDIPGNGLSSLLEINFVFVSAFVSSLMYVPECHIALQIFSVCFFKRIRTQIQLASLGDLIIFLNKLIIVWEFDNFLREFTLDIFWVKVFSYQRTSFLSISWT